MYRRLANVDPDPVQQSGKLFLDAGADSEDEEENTQMIGKFGALLSPRSVPMPTEKLPDAGTCAVS